MKIKFPRVLNLVFGLAAASMVVISCKDDFTEEDLLNKQAELAKDNVELAVLVYNGSVAFSTGGNSGGRTAEEKGLAGIDVTISLNGTATTVQTDANGLANFTGLSQGTVAGVIKGTDITTTNFVVSIKKDENATAGKVGSVINAGVIIPVYETSGPNTATVSGRATCETNMLNNTRENVPDGVNVAFSIVPRESSYGYDYEYDYYEGEYYPTFFPFFGQTEQKAQESLANARVESISYEGNFVATIAGGNYSITLPTAHEGLVFNVQFSDFTANQDIAVDHYENEPNGSIRAVQTLSTLFSQSTWADLGADYGRYEIPYVESLQFDIAAPPASGSGAAATAQLVATSLAPAGFSILANGSGYPVNSTTIPVTVNGGSYNGSVTGAAVADLNAQSDASGRIVGIIVNNPGFGYRSQATLTIGGGGTGAVVRVNFQSQVAGLGFTDASAGTTLSAGGTGYVVAPVPYFQGYTFGGEFIESSATAVAVNGSVVSFTVPGTFWASAPTVTFRPATRVQATAEIGSVGRFGDILSVGMNSSGNAYNPLSPPTVTIRDLRGAGGSGAAFLADMSASGFINSIIIMNSGSGYSRTGNANFPTSAQQFQIDTDNNNGTTEYPYTVIVMQPGHNRIMNAYYGTGIHERSLDYYD